MRTKLLFIALFALAAAAVAETPTVSYKSLQYPPLNRIKAPQPLRYELPNGMVVYLLEDHELPKIGLHVFVRAGSRWEPAAKAGLASITGTVMRTGGSLTENGDQLDEELDRLGASVETSIGQDSGSASATLLKEDLDRCLAILADILQHPAFPQDKIDLARIAERDAIARRNDDPSAIAFREFNRVLYGKDSPYARLAEYATIDAITRDDLVAFHKRFFQPENVILGVEGDFDSAAMRARIEKAFGGWARGGAPKPVPPAVDEAARSRAGLYSIDKDDMQQSWVLMGMLGGRRDDPDYCALQVMNEILGGGFVSRLFVNVRSAQGLAYAVFSNASSGWDRPGTFLAGGSTKSETTLKIYGAIRDQIERLAAGGATPDELARAKDGILKGMAFDFDSTAKILGRLMNYEYYGYPRDFLQRYRAGIESVTLSQVAQAAAKYLKPAQFAVVIAGNEKAYDGPLASLGPVSPIDISIPLPKQEALVAATPDTFAKGRALLVAVRAAMGGTALMKVKEITVSADALMATPQGQVTLKTESTTNLSGKLLNKVLSPAGDMNIGYDGKTGWMSLQGQTQLAPAEQTAQLRASVLLQTLALLQAFEQPAYSVQALGPAAFEGAQTQVVAISNPAAGLTVKLYIDPATDLVVGKSYSDAMGAPGPTVEVYSSYHDVKGIKVPFKTVVKQGDRVGAELTVTGVQVNPGIPEAWYRKP
jgi:zinc protease